MDAAQELEQRILARQSPMNAVIDRGDSAVQLFYRDAVVFVTGGSGFLGKQLIEKLFRSCAIKKIYVLLRPKKGKPIQERLDFMLIDSVFDLVREKQPTFADRIVPVEGDVADIRLGLSDKDWTKVAEEVDIIIHMAATVRFDAPIRAATLTNVRGTREVITLAKDCKKLKCFLHVSTAFTHATTSRVGTDLKEQFYPCPVPPDVMIDLVESVEENRLDDMTTQLIKDWPNTYTFTKAIAEELVRTEAAGLPACVVKPPVVMSAYMEPAPGWSDLSVMYGPSGVMIGAGLGVLHLYYCKSDVRLNLAPVDIVNNAIIAAGWDSVVRRNASEEIPIYNISSTKCRIDTDLIVKIGESDASRRLASPKALWYCYVIKTDNTFIYWILTWFLHYIPAYMVDGICYLLGVKLKEIPSAIKVYEKFYKMSKFFSHFFCNEWDFKDDNLTEMISRMSDEDKMIYNCDITSFEYAEYLRVTFIGLRKYIVKDGLVDSYKSYQKQKWYKLMNIVFLALYVYVIFMIMFYFYKSVKYVVY